MKRRARIGQPAQRALARAGERVMRAKKGSRQPRFERTDMEYMFSSIYRWVKMADLEEPAYSSISTTRDEWLRRFWHRESLLAGVTNSVVLLDANRGWTLTGGRNQVSRYLERLHNLEDGKGWRTFLKKGRLSYCTTDLGFVGEKEVGSAGELISMYHVDPVRCQLTGMPAEPLEYMPLSGEKELWPRGSFIHVADMPSDDEAYNDLGFCATSRALELAKILVAIYQHDNEMLGSRMPKGVLLLKNIQQSQWDESMEMREANLDSVERKYYGGLQVIATGGPYDADIVIRALSQLPANLDRRELVDQTMNGYALAHNRDAREFWPVSGGALGTGKETEVQHRKATEKGQFEFLNPLQEDLQRVLPPTLDFQFEQRDDEGQLLLAEVADAWAKVAKLLYEAGAANEEGPLLMREQSLRILADQNIIPAEWAELAQEAQADDTEAEVETLQDEALTRMRVQRAIRQFPEESIVQYSWPADKVRTLWRNGHEALARRIHPVPVQRAILHEGEGVVITEEDAATAITAGRQRLGEQYAQLLEASAYA